MRAVVGWALVGSGVAVAAGVGVTFSVLAGDEQSVVDDAVRGTPWSTLAPHEQAYATYSALAIAGFLVGTSIAVGGAVLLILDAVDGSEDDELAPAVEPTVALTPDGVGLGLVGRF